MGNVAIGGALDAARSLSLPSLHWWALLGLGWACGAVLFILNRNGHLCTETTIPMGERSG